jgi:hypothetical protein
MRVRTLVPGAFMAVLVALAAFGVSARAYAPGNPVVVSDRQAALDDYDATTPPGGGQSAVQPNTQIEPAIAVNPGDHNDVVTDYQVGRVDAGGDADNGFGTSLNGGLSWTYGNLPGLTKAAPTPVSSGVTCPTDLTVSPYDRASDAVVTFGKDPTGQAHGGYFAYAQSLVFDDSTCSALPSGMAINVSSDGGLTWSNALMLEGDAGGGLNDKNWVVSDNGTGLGHHPGRTYIVWDRVATVEIAYCDPDSPLSGTFGVGCDKIQNWSTVSGKIFQPIGAVQGIGSFPVVLNNGSLGVLYKSLTAAPCSPNECEQGTIGIGSNQWTLIAGAGATPFGSALPAPLASTTVDSYQGGHVEFQRAGTLPQVAHDPVTDDLVAVWEDNRYRTDSAGAPGNQNDAVAAVSTDMGATWSLPIRINQGPTGDQINHYNTTVAIGADGIWRVAYRQRNEAGITALTPGIDSYYQESRDQGATWTAPLKINTSSPVSDPQFGAFSRGGLFQGDYEVIAAGGPDESYFTRDESFQLPGGPSTCTTNFSTPQPCQNQTTWVAHLLPQNTATTPDARFVPALVLVGGGAAMAVILVRRRRRSTVPE